MSDLGDRVIVLLIAATALGVVLWWVVGFIRASVTGTTRFALMGAAGALYVLILVGAWLEFAHIDHEAPGKPD